MNKPFAILLVEDNPADVRLAREAFKVRQNPKRPKYAQKTVWRQWISCTPAR